MGGDPAGRPARGRGFLARVLNVHAPGRGFGEFVRALGDGDDETRAAERTGFDQIS